MTRFALGLAAFLMTTPALADETAAPSSNSTQPPASAEQPQPDPKICRKYPAPVGSRLGEQRICHTQHEWDLIEQTSRDTVNKIDQGSQRGTHPGG